MYQPFWAARVAALDGGPTALPRKSLSIDALSTTLHDTVHDDTMAQRARPLGEAIRSEDGVASAVEILDRFAPA